MIKKIILFFYILIIFVRTKYAEIPQDIVILSPNNKDSIIYRENVQFFFRRAFKPYHILVLADVGNNTFYKEVYSC